MVALLLGTILIGGAVSVYLASSRSFEESERSIRLLDNGRFALQTLENTLRHGGFFGGVVPGGITRDGSLGTVNGDCTGQIEAEAYNLDIYLYATTADASGDALGCIDDAVPGTDVLVVKALVPAPISDGDPDAATPVLDGTLDFPNTPAGNTTYIVANAELGLLVDGADSGTWPSVNDGETYARGQAWPYSYQVFYIRLVDDRAPPAPDIVALARKRLNFNSGAMEIITEDLVRGIADMRIRFRYDSNDDGDVDSAGYEDDLAAADWNRVGSAEIFLLAQSLERDLDYLDEKTYTLGDRTFTPDASDNVEPFLWRMLVNQQITLRNPNLVIHGGGV